MLEERVRDDIVGAGAAPGERKDIVVKGDSGLGGVVVANELLGVQDYVAFQVEAQPEGG